MNPPKIVCGCLAGPSRQTRCLVLDLVIAGEIEFAKFVSDHMELFDLDDEDVADELPVSTSTVKRWREGQATPLPQMRRPVVAFFHRLVTERFARDSDDLTLPEVPEDAEVPLL